jgi:protein arginine kinase activator
MSERPVECSDCKRKIKIIYKEIVDQTITCAEMCDECPVLKAKLHGDSNPASKKESSLCCGVCGTSLESVKMGQPVGCAECYMVFGDAITAELVATESIPSSLKKRALTQRSEPLHIGRLPEQKGPPALSSKLASLNEALGEALKKENYEQAAYLRDQIKAITDKHE